MIKGRGRPTKVAIREVSIRALVTAELYQKLKSRAERDRRTISTTLMMILESALEDDDSHLKK
jgi:hypothetical protein